MIRISDFWGNKPLKDFAIDTLFDYSFLFGTLSLIKPYANEADLPEFKYKAVWFLFTNVMIRGASKFFQDNAADFAMTALGVYHLALFSPHLFGFLHEYGHKLAADYLCGGNSSLEFYLGGAMQHYEETPACSEYRSLITTAGPVAEVAAISCGIIAGHLVRHWRPYVSWALRAVAVCKVACLTLYALSAFKEEPGQSHDFYNLWKAGIVSPIASIAVIIAVPVLAQLGVSSFAKEDPVT